MTAPANPPREHLAWLMYCYQQGYTNPIDRACLTNWMADPDDQLHPDDIVLRRHLLGMADEILALLAQEASRMSEAGGGLTYPDSAGDETCDSCTCCTVAGCVPSQCGEDDYGRFHCPCTSE
jgi:hypothetical protein